MKEWRFEVYGKAGFPDVHAEGVFEDIKELGIGTVEGVQSAKVYLIEADFEADFAKRVAEELLCDTVCQDYHIGRSGAPAGPAKATLVEVHLKSGVTDPVAESVVTAIRDMGGKPASVRTANEYVLCGGISDSELETISRRVLANDCIEDVIYGSDAEPPSPHTKPNA